jgi:cytochrome P450
LVNNAEHALNTKIDKAMTGFVDQLFAQRRRAALLGPRGGLMISDPQTCDAILSHPEKFPKTFGLLEEVGLNRFCTNGTEWEWRRDLTQRSYFRSGASSNREKVGEVYGRRLASCKDTQPATITRALLAASTEIFHDSLGCQVEIEGMLGFYDQTRDLLRQLQYFSLVPPNSDQRAALKRKAQSLSQLYLGEIQKSPTLMDLMERFAAEAKGHSVSFVPSDELMMNFFAAVETTTATLGTAIDRLGVYKEAQNCLFQEVASGKAPVQLECFINETLRYYPPIPMMVRRAVSDTELEGVKLKAGSIVVISVVGIHHHPDYWKEAGKFDWLRSEFLENDYDRRAFIPFSAGIRSCGGARLARMELSEGLKAFLRRFIVNRQGNDLSFDYAMAVRPKSWDQVEIARRSTSPTK